MKKTRILTLCECAVMLALSIVLSFIVIYKMPMGGGITLLSMLPIMLIGVKHGMAWGVGTAFIYSCFQLLQGVMSGDVFVWCTTWQTVLIVVLFDYLAPFTLLGLSGAAKSKNGKISLPKISATLSVLIACRFVCHFITGFYIWGQWAPEGMGKYMYSLIYNGQYMLPELIFTVVAASIVISVPQMKKLFIK